MYTMCWLTAWIEQTVVPGYGSVTVGVYSSNILNNSLKQAWQENFLRIFSLNPLLILIIICILYAK
jgi:hypothetical protein